jgi:hypothetical protein
MTVSEAESAHWFCRAALFTTVRRWGVEIVPVDWAKDKLLGQPVNPIQRSVGSSSRPSWSADGKYLSCISTVGLVTVSADTGRIVREVRPKMGFVSYAQPAPEGIRLLL